MYTKDGAVDNLTGGYFAQPTRAADEWVKTMTKYLDLWRDKAPERGTPLAGACTFLESARSSVEHENPWAAVDGLLLTLAFYAWHHGELPPAAEDEPRLVVVQ